MSAELFLHNWVAHDLLHFRQITGLRFGWLKANSAVPVDHAGTW